MLKNIELIKTQLSELASVINLYKSEAVQLKIVDLVFKHAMGEDSSETNREANGRRKLVKAKKRKAGSNANRRTEKTTGTGKKKSSRLGTAAALQRLLDIGYFKSKRRLGDIASYCETKLASPIKRTALSGPLARLVHDGKLDRDKNKEDGQYEYIQK
jgi:hypothetical protein